MSALRAMHSGYGPAFFGNGPDDDAPPESERIAEELGLPHYHWLADAVADALDSGDALYLLSQCKKHLAPRCPR